MPEYKVDFTILIEDGVKVEADCQCDAKEQVESFIRENKELWKTWDYRSWVDEVVQPVPEAPVGGWS